MYDNILLFIKLVEIGSFSKLATITGTAQSTISRKIQALEQKLQVELFLRSSNSINLSHAGKLLYNKFKNHEIYLNESITEIRAQQSQLKGMLRVALPIVISKNTISPFIADFLKKYPNIDLIISYKTTHIELIQEGFDLAITISPPKSKNNIVTLLKTFHLQLYATPYFLKNHGPIETIEEAIQKSTIGYLALDGRTIDEFVATNLVTGKTTHECIKHPRIYIDNLINIAELARSGEIMITAWDSVIQDELSSGALIKILPEYSFREIPCYLLRPSLACSALQHVFIEFIKECFSREIVNN